jgi:hypothetical protein
VVAVVVLQPQVVAQAQETVVMVAQALLQVHLLLEPVAVAVVTETAQAPHHQVDQAAVGQVVIILPVPVLSTQAVVAVVADIPESRAQAGPQVDQV